jgi:hypothetical protein
MTRDGDGYLVQELVSFFTSLITSKEVGHDVQQYCFGDVGVRKRTFLVQKATEAPSAKTFQTTGKSAKTW